ncbi:hypothetical protein LPH59_11605 [Xylella taiwanensis]|nr:hypothetical protein [Xylella taiwanensis]MCD8461834.1 hypothetical protein [Xylella taiwanensis]MCD8468758.1 hypothetical protein [Xylella taiwanensis]
MEEDVVQRAEHPKCCNSIGWFDATAHRFFSGWNSQLACAGVAGRPSLI